LIFFVGTFSGRALGRRLFFFRTTFYSGVFLQLVGVFVTSLATEYWQLQYFSLKACALVWAMACSSVP
jgi:hypothetical protein